MVKHGPWLSGLLAVALLAATLAGVGLQVNAQHPHHPASAVQGHEHGCGAEPCEAQSLAHAHHEPSDPSCHSLTGHCSGALGVGSAPLISRSAAGAGFGRPHGRERLTSPSVELDTPPPRA